MSSSSSPFRGRLARSKNTACSPSPSGQAATAAQTMAHVTSIHVSSCVRRRRRGHRLLHGENSRAGSSSRAYATPPHARCDRARFSPSTLIHTTSTSQSLFFQRRRFLGLQNPARPHGTATRAHLIHRQQLDKERYSTFVRSATSGSSNFQASNRTFLLLFLRSPIAPEN